MLRRRSMTAMFAAGALLLGGCSGGGTTPRSAPTLPSASTTTTVVHVTRGQSLALHAMAYLASNPLAPVLGLFARASAAVVVGAPSEVVVRLDPVRTPVWVGLHARRLAVNTHEGAGRITVATDGCSLTGTASCPSTVLYAPTAFPIGPAPNGGRVTNGGFALHVDTASLQPGGYAMTFPVRYPSSVNRPNVLDVADTLHVQLDVGNHAPPTTRCTAADLHRPVPTPPAAHALASTVVLVHGDDRLDPPGAAKSRIPASVAWTRLSASVGGTGGASSLVLALVTARTPARALPDGALVEETHNVLAWVLYTHNQAVNSGLVGGAGPSPHGHPIVSAQPCAFLDGINAIDATTGRELLAEGGTAEHDPILF